MNIIERDILTVDSGIILHQLNLHGSMGGGIAYAISKKWSHVNDLYEDFCKKCENPFGKVLFTTAISRDIGNNLVIGNCFSQMEKQVNGTLTDYEAVRKCFEFVKPYAQFHDIYIPFQYGCGIAGGDWSIVFKIIEDVLPMATICILPSLAQQMRSEGRMILCK